MDCKFLNHGIAIGYDSMVKPCCEWSRDSDWNDHNHTSKIDLVTWHDSKSLRDARDKLKNNIWPDSCIRCSRSESQNRSSMRQDGLSAYDQYQPGDITLEIRPGAVCNFACQTCWPMASTRVANFHHQAGLIDIKQVVSPSLDDYEFLSPIAHRIRNLVILGGEPFYDKNCLKFLYWASDHLEAKITLFTNGSAVDWDWVDQYPGKIILVFSIDAVGKPAEYIRFGTEWAIVEQNLQRAHDHPNVELRVNITQTVYSYYYISDIIDLLVPCWPSVVMFGLPQESHFQEHVVPSKYREEIILKLSKSVKKIQQADIESGQKSHATNALNSLISNLQSHPWNLNAYNTFKKFVSDMDRVKHVNIRDYCEFVADVLSEQPVEIL
jgi:hypothetical protein